MACILLYSSAVRVHDSQAYRKMDVTRERISCIWELREILLTFQTSFNLASAAVVCAVLVNISGIAVDIKLICATKGQNREPEKYGEVNKGKRKLDRRTVH